MPTRTDTREHAVRVRSMTLEAEGVLSVELEAVAGSLPGWEPGAHIDLAAPGAPTRQYSLCGDPAAGRYRIAVLRETTSRGGSRHVHEALRPGDVLSLRGPRNHFALETAPRTLFIAGGIGVTPLLPMVRRAAAEGARWRLLYLGSSRARMPFLDELATLGGDVVVVARDEAKRADLAQEVAAWPDALVYACGPERMLVHLRELIPDEDRLRCEYFSAPAVEYEPGGTFAVRLARSGAELEVPPERSVLDVMREAGVDVLTDCEEGICGSCETRVLEGEVEHRDFVLTTQERAAHDCMMVCVSRAACPLLVLDA
ncbi:PDR/VanB family oxidoreductase [Jiangella endophytica]|uniref:PDR/VanB family oxidoreductase n=1 Tax=Jiangella endophytica TaxID=1623398 RepID=UPI000E355711|nr:PDR/VanB family oxidoreductase [Jiangella endophytica]